jgi:hypothetical protein
VSERERREQFEELTLLQTWGSELCLAIIGQPWVRNHLLEGMWATALRNTEMGGDLAVLRAVVSSTVESVLGRSSDETFRVEVMGELAVEFWKQEEQRSWLERPSARICDLLLGPPPGQARLADHLDEVVGQLGPRWLHGGRWTQSWRPYRLWLSESGTWCWIMPTGPLPWQHPCPR